MLPWNPRSPAVRAIWFRFRFAWNRATWSRMLEALAQVSFPINPQIYHDAAIVYVYPDRPPRRREATTLVEFPAYAARLDEVRRAVESHGFDPASVHVTAHAGRDPLRSDPRDRLPRARRTSPAGRVKNRTAAAVH